MAVTLLNKKAEKFKHMYENVYHDMFRFAYYTLKTVPDAEDAVSETVVDAYSSFHRLREEERFKAWIFRILSVKCKRRLKEKISHSSVPIEEELLPQIKEPMLQENLDLKNAFFNLSQEERLIVAMSVFGGYNSREIGKILLLKDTTVRSKLSRALDKMKQELSFTEEISKSNVKEVIP